MSRDRCHEASVLAMSREARKYDVVILVPPIIEGIEALTISDCNLNVNNELKILPFAKSR